jgi:hypothetical protein
MGIDTSEMEYSLDFDSQPGRLVVAFSGQPSPEAFDSFFAEAVADPRWRPGMDVITDLRPLHLAQLGSDAVEQIVASRQRHDAEIGPIRKALVVDAPADWGVARMFAALTETRFQFKPRLFHSMEEATTWLDSPAD